MTLICPYNQVLSNRNRAIDSHNTYEFKTHFAIHKWLGLKGYKLYNSMNLYDILGKAKL